MKIDLASLYSKLQYKTWSLNDFRFYTAVSVIASSRIEGELMEIDSYIKHKIHDIEYLPLLTEKPNDLYIAYEFARDHSLNKENFLQAHSIATAHLLPEKYRGVLRNVNMVVLDQQTQRVQYEAAMASIVNEEFTKFWNDIDDLMRQNLNIDEVFYYASLIHLVFVKIHPFNDGNGRSARLLEKWFLASKIGEKAWFLGSEFFYYQNLNAYYQNLARVGLFYDALDYHKSIDFLLMLPKSLQHIE